MGPSSVLRRAPLLVSFAPRFTNWFEHAPSLSPKTRRYYRAGLGRIVNTELAGMTLDRITTEEVDSLRLKGSPLESIKVFELCVDCWGNRLNGGSLLQCRRSNLSKNKEGS